MTEMKAQGNARNFPDFCAKRSHDVEDLSSGFGVLFSARNTDAAPLEPYTRVYVTLSIVCSLALLAPLDPDCPLPWCPLLLSSLLLVHSESGSDSSISALLLTESPAIFNSESNGLALVKNFPFIKATLGFPHASKTDQSDL